MRIILCERLIGKSISRGAKWHTFLLCFVANFQLIEEPIKPLVTFTLPPPSLSPLSDARGVVIDPEKYLVNDVTGTLKQFFQSLPDPLLTHQLYHSFISTMRE